MGRRGARYGHPSGDLPITVTAARVANQPWCTHGTQLSQLSSSQRMTMVLEGRAPPALGPLDVTMKWVRSCQEWRPLSWDWSKHGHEQEAENRMLVSPRKPPKPGSWQPSEEPGVAFVYQYVFGTRPVQRSDFVTQALMLNRLAGISCLQGWQKKYTESS